MQEQAALEVAVAEMGVDIIDHNAVQQWLSAPVCNNGDMFQVLKAYHTKVMRPEFFLDGAA